MTRLSRTLIPLSELGSITLSRRTNDESLLVPQGLLDLLVSSLASLSPLARPDSLDLLVYSPASPVPPLVPWASLVLLETVPQASPILVLASPASLFL
jgi:hypothetical protein